MMDTIYFGRRFGVMVLYDGISGQALSVDEVKSETNELYFEAVCNIREKGINIQSITCDGKKGLMQMFADIPVQRCHFHQVKTVNRYPKAENGSGARLTRACAYPEKQQPTPI